MFACGPAIYCPIYDLRSGALLFSDFNDGTATDQIPPPATPTLNGDASLSFVGGAFVPANTNSTSAYISWAGAKLGTGIPALGAWTMECVVSWITIPNAASSNLLRILDGASNNNLVGFFQTAGQLSINNVATGVFVPATPTHIALGSDGKLWVGGALGTTVGLNLLAACATFDCGPASYQGPRNFAIDWVRLSASILYTAPFSPPGPA